MKPSFLELGCLVLGMILFVFCQLRRYRGQPRFLLILECILYPSIAVTLWVLFIKN